MGTYSHYTTDELQTLRKRLSDSLVDRLTSPTAISHSNGSGGSRNAQYAQDPDKIKKEISAIAEEIGKRTGGPKRGPIYIV